MSSFPLKAHICSDNLTLPTVQLTVTGGGSARPAGVSFPGAYSASDPGIGLSIHGNLQSYTVPGPALYSGGTSKVPGPNAVCQGVEAGTAPGPDPTTTRGSQQTTTTTRAQQQTTTTANNQQPTTTSASNPNGCTTQKYGQCGGNGFTGCTNCAVS